MKEKWFLWQINQQHKLIQATHPTLMSSKYPISYSFEPVDEADKELNSLRDKYKDCLIYQPQSRCPSWVLNVVNWL